VAIENSAASTSRGCPTRGLPFWRWFVACALATALALADGIVVSRDHLGRWNLQEEESQLCLINYENGVERMLVSVALSDLRGARAAWIVPIPSAPDSTAVDIVKGFPAFAGTNIVARAERVVVRQFARMSLMQIYPALFLRDPNREAGIDVVYGLLGSDSEEISVHSRKEEMGLTTELVTADHPGAMVGYLTEKGIDLPDAARPVLDEYGTDSFSFVVTWISDTGAFMRESLTAREYQDMTPAIGVSVSFPTRRAYFPLRPTSVYGNTEVPIDVYIIGHAIPALYSRLTQDAATSVDYFTQTDYRVPEALRTFFSGRAYVRQLHYTHVGIRARSFNLKQDLWFEPGPPRAVTCARLLNGYQLFWVPLLFLLCSCLASTIAGAVVLRRFRLPLLLQACFGLWNFLTLVGLATLAHVTMFRERGSAGITSPEDPPRSAGIGRKVLFILLFTAVFQALLGLSYVIVRAAL